LVVVHAFLALIAGFLTMVILVGIATALLVKFASGFVGPQGRPHHTYIAFNLVYSFLAAAVGGYITTWIANQNPLSHALVLALVVLLLSALSAIQQRGRQPIAYQLTLLALTPVGVILGAVLRLKLTGIL